MYPIKWTYLTAINSPVSEFKPKITLPNEPYPKTLPAFHLYYYKKKKKLEFKNK